MKKHAAAGKGALGHIMLGAAWVLFAAGLRAGGPCDPPPFDPLSPVATAEAAVEMDSWAIRALRRDVRGRTCTEVQEVVDILLVRWLQAHPNIVIAFEGAKERRWLGDSAEFMHHLKAEAWAEVKAQRTWFPRRWGKKPASPEAQRRRAAFVSRTLERLQNR